MKLNRLLSHFLTIFLLLLFSTQSLSALDNVKEIKGTLTIFNPEFQHLSPFWGLVWVESKLLSSLFRIGHGIKLQAPESYQVSRNPTDKSITGDATPALAHEFFVKTHGGTLETTLSKSKFSIHLTPAMVAHLVHGTIVGSFANKKSRDAFIETFLTKYPRQKEENEEKTADKNKTHKRRLRKLLKTIHSSLLESVHLAGRGALYSPNTTISIILSFLYKKCTSKQDLWDYLNQLKVLFGEEVTLFQTDPCSDQAAQQNWLADNYQDSEEQQILSEFKIDDESRNGTLSAILNSSTECEKFIYAQVIHNFYSGPLPPTINYRKQIYQSKSFNIQANENLEFSDCVETALRNLINIACYDRSTSLFNTNLLPHKIAMQEIANFYNHNTKASESTADRLHQTWAPLLRNIQNVTYRRCILSQDDIRVTHHPCLPLVHVRNEKLEHKRSQVQVIEQEQAEFFEITARTNNFVRILNRIFKQEWNNFEQACEGLGLRLVSSLHPEEPQYENNNTFHIISPMEHPFELTLSERHAQVSVERSADEKEAQNVGSMLSALLQAELSPLTENLILLMASLAPLEASLHTLFATNSPNPMFNLCIFSQDFTSFQSRLSILNSILHFISTSITTDMDANLIKLLLQICRDIIEQFYAYSQSNNTYYLNSVFQSILSSKAYKFGTFQYYLANNSMGTDSAPDSVFVRTLRFSFLTSIIKTPMFYSDDALQLIGGIYSHQLELVSSVNRARLLIDLLAQLQQKKVRKHFRRNPFLQKIASILNKLNLPREALINIFRQYLRSRLPVFNELKSISAALSNQLDHALGKDDRQLCFRVATQILKFFLHLPKQDKKEYAHFMDRVLMLVKDAEKFDSSVNLLLKIIKAKIHSKHNFGWFITNIPHYLPKQEARAHFITELLSKYSVELNNEDLKTLIEDFIRETNDPEILLSIATTIFNAKRRITHSLLVIVIESLQSENEKLTCVKNIVTHQASILLNVNFPMLKADPKVKALLQKEFSRAKRQRKEIIKNIIKKYFSEE